MFWVISVRGCLEGDELVMTSFRLLWQLGGQIRKRRAQCGLLEWLVVGWEGAWLVGWAGGLDVYMGHDSWCKVSSVGMRNMWGHSMQHLVQPMVVSWLCGRERKAGACSRCTWS